MFDPTELERLFPTPDDIEKLGDLELAAKELLQLSQSRAPVKIDFEDAKILTEHFKLAKQAAAKFQHNRFANLTQEEQQALHAYVHLVTRPSLQIDGGKIRGIPESWPLLHENKSVIEDMVKSVGRLDRVDNGTRHRVATGWFVAENLMLTNNHVVAGLCEIDPHLNPNWRQQLESDIAEFNNRWRSNPDTRPTWDPADNPTSDIADAAGRVVHADLHPFLDMAMLTVEGVTNSGILAIPLSKVGPQHAEHKIYTIGYPAVRMRDLHPALINLLFQTEESGMRKRVAPGELLNINESPVSHDATTLAGKSGGVVLDIESHSAVGLHFSGLYGVRNDAVPLWKHQNDTFFTRHGVHYV
jgi:endonuclease G